MKKTTSLFALSLVALIGIALPIDAASHFKRMYVSVYCATTTISTVGVYGIEYNRVGAPMY